MDWSVSTIKCKSAAVRGSVEKEFDTYKQMKDSYNPSLITFAFSTDLDHHRGTRICNKLSAMHDIMNALEKR